MPKTSKREALSRQFSRRLFPLALAIGFFITFVIPGIYYAVEFSRASGEAHTHAIRLAHDIGKLASETPGLWKYQATRYAQILSDFVPGREIMSILVLDETGRRVTHYEHAKTVNRLMRGLHIHGDPAPIMFNNRNIGEIEVTVSAYKIILKTFFSFLAMISIALPGHEW